MNIAIVGAGFLGIGCCWHLLKLPSISVTLFDAKGIGSGASGIAAGLLHPYAGAKALRNWMADEAYPETIKLLDVASATLKQPVYKASGIFRPATTVLQHTHFRKTAKRYSDCIWQDAAPSTLFRHPIMHSGLFIPSGIQVDCPLYLEGLWKACQLKGAKLVIQKINSPNDLTEFDLIVFTIGTGFLKLPEHAMSAAIPPLSALKGQLIELAWDEELPFGVSSHAYLAQAARSGPVIAGATFEHAWDVEGADRKSCEEEIRSKVEAFCPKASKLPLQNCKAGFRAVTKDKKPFLVKPLPNCYCLGGLGSKGLLYHAWLAALLQKDVCLSGHVKEKDNAWR